MLFSPFSFMPFLPGILVYNSFTTFATIIGRPNV